VEPLNKDDYTLAHTQFLPRGMVWPRHLSSLWMKLFAAFSRTYAEIHGTLTLLADELDPRKASLMLEEWEKFAGLPDECTLVAGTEPERQAALVAKLTSTGGATAPYFVEVAETMGYIGAAVEEFPVSRYGRVRFGARFRDRRWRRVWQVNLPASGVLDAALECRIRKLKPAHTKVYFQYEA
jgi:uncharacterized protein YmfQ (DUF2313 family)